MTKEIRNPRGNCKTQAACNFQGPFPLTPALSLRERENQGPRWNNSKWRPFSNALPMILPLPEGEGRGEGERIVRRSERCDFCNRLPNQEIRTLRHRGTSFDRCSELFSTLRVSDSLRFSAFGLVRTSHE